VEVHVESQVHLEWLSGFALVGKHPDHGHEAKAFDTNEIHGILL
jgi:hypothetical protein